MDQGKLALRIGALLVGLGLFAGCEILVPQDYQIEYRILCDGICNVTADLEDGPGETQQFQVDGAWSKIVTMSSGEEAYIRVSETSCSPSSTTPPDVRILQGGEEVGRRDSDGRCIVVVAHTVGRR